MTRSMTAARFRQRKRRALWKCGGHRPPLQPDGGQRTARPTFRHSSLKGQKKTLVKNFTMRQLLALVFNEISIICSPVFCDAAAGEGRGTGGRKPRGHRRRRAGRRGGSFAHGGHHGVSHRCFSCHQFNAGDLDRGAGDDPVRQAGHAQNERGPRGRAEFLGMDGGKPL